MPSNVFDGDHIAFFFLEILQVFSFQLESLNISFAMYFLEYIKANLETNDDQLMKKL